MRLPGRRPPPVVGLVGRQRTSHRTVASLRAQVGVHVDRRVSAGQREQAAQFVGHAERRIRRRLVIDALPAPVHEHHVRVRSVSEFLPAVATHADDDEFDQVLGRPVIYTHDLSGDSQSRLDRRIRDVRQRLAHLVDGQKAQTVGRRDAEKFAPTGGPDGSDGRLRVGLSQTGSERLGGDIGGRSGPQLFVVGQHLHRIRGSQQQIRGER